MKHKKTTGFTLIELMVVVAIVGILAAIAIPSYQKFILRGHRAAAQAQMLYIANLEQQYILSNRVYAGGTGSDMGYALPSEVASRYGYSIALGDADAPPSFIITFDPSGAQDSDGNLVLTSAGVKTRWGDETKW